jgi:GTPase SAR1 family protein
MFHKTCDNIGETITLVSLDNGQRIGGYTSIPWSSKEVVLSDKKAFLFSFIDGNLHTFSASTTEHSQVYHNPTLGPTFGGSTAASKQFDLCLDTPFIRDPPLSFVKGKDDPPIAKTNNNGLEFQRIEVFHVEPTLGSPSPFLSTNLEDLNMVKNQIVSDINRLVARKLQNVNFFLFGDPGVGKSRFINTLCASLSTRRYSNIVPSKPSPDHVTKMMMARPLKGLIDVPKELKLGVTFFDSYGSTANTYQKSELSFFLTHSLGDYWEMNDPLDMDRMEKKSPEDWMHLVLFFISGSPERLKNADNLKHYKDRIEEILNYKKTNYSNILIILTHADDIDPDLKVYPERISGSIPVMNATQKLADDLSVDLNWIVPTINFVGAESLIPVPLAIQTLQVFSKGLF